MTNMSVAFCLVCLILSITTVAPHRFQAAKAAQEQGEEQWQLPGSRDFADSIWKEKRKPSKQQSKRRKYQRVGVASSSATALKYQKLSVASVNASVKRDKPARPGLVWQDVSLAGSEQVGVTIWRLRRCVGKDNTRCFLKLNDAQGRGYMYEALRVTSETDFQLGDAIQLAIEAPSNGFIYVIHQEVYPNGLTSKPKLLYPQSDGVNSVSPGKPLLIPTQVAGEGVKVLKMRNDQGRSLAAERLKIIITKRPLQGIFVQGRPRYLGVDDLSQFESEWSGRLELFDLEDGDKETMSLNEWYSMQDRNDSRDLTTEDLAPQKLYLVEPKAKDGVLITLDLPYARSSVGTLK